MGLDCGGIIALAEFTHGRRVVARRKKVGKVSAEFKSIIERVWDLSREIFRVRVLVAP
jgi:hypothetical protein